MRGLISLAWSRRISAALSPRLLVQFWDDASDVPLDVQACLDSWAPLEQLGFTRLLFDDATALRFIDDHFTPRQVLAFNGCGHPAMRADYFRLCFMVKVGGMYVDADDRYLGQSINSIVGDGRLQLQPLCYDIPSDSMLNPYKAAAAGEDSSHIFYVNNNPLIAPAGHPLVVRALERATDQIISPGTNERDIQSITGPGNLTACLVEHALELQAEEAELDFTLLPNWDATAVSTWPLQYRSDERNWRKWAHNNG
jgi:mannosyltransferase OCH1-like enzyme